MWSIEVAHTDVHGDALTLNEYIVSPLFEGMEVPGRQATSCRFLRHNRGTVYNGLLRTGRSGGRIDE
jgi:hypothetical protein